MLKGFRERAGHAHPGDSLGGWCQKTANVVFGQWLSGMARMSKAAGDEEIGDKAAYLMREWGKSMAADGNAGLSHYSYDKALCGLVDLYLYNGREDALPLMEKITDWAIKHLDRERTLATLLEPQSTNLEWYTLSENLYRAYQATGNEKYKSFGDIWRYEDYWNQLADGKRTKSYIVHGYSHVNSFNGAAMTYAVTGDPRYLRILKNAYDFLQETQCFATGGYGPFERLVPPDGTLGDTLQSYCDSFEAPCGSWAGFKMSRYLMTLTGESRYGDWMEQLYYNGIGAALPMEGRGRTFYYADYRIGTGHKLYFLEAFPCCSGTYAQDVADYHNVIYFKDADGLYVNLFVPSELTWKRGGDEVTLTQKTSYPEAGTVDLSLAMSGESEFPLRIRVPGWARGFSIEVNGADAGAEIRPGQWATLKRRWKNGDRVAIRVPDRFQFQPVDEQHPNRVAIRRGAVVLVQDGWFTEEARDLPPENEITGWLTPHKEEPGVFESKDREGKFLKTGRFLPFYQIPEQRPYRMYLDRKA